MVQSIVGSVVCILLLGCSADFTSSSQVVPLDSPVSQQSSLIDNAPQSPNDVMENWFYGQGLGEAALNIAGVVLFPPYGLYVLGNGVAQALGYEQFSIGDALPEDVGSEYKAGYDEVAGAPGRFTAALGGKEFRSKEAIQSRNRSAGDARGTTDQEFGNHS